MAINYGASALGLVGKMPSGPGVIEDGAIAAIARSVPPPISTFLLTSETDAKNVINHHQKTHTSTIQLVDEIPDNAYQKIRASIPGIKLVQVVHVLDASSIDYAIKVAENSDALLLDSGNPAAAIKILGGTGKTHNWKLSRNIVEQVHIPVFLAGGLTSENVQEAVETVQPFGVDLCSSVRTSGNLDERKLSQFMKAAGY
jgi:phosphoribosylanthranilate isomerase